METAPKVLLIETNETMRNDLQEVAARSQPTIVWQSVEHCTVARGVISSGQWDIVFIAVDAPGVAIGDLLAAEGVRNYLRDQFVGDVVGLLEVIGELTHAPDVVLVSEGSPLRAAAYRQLRAMGCREIIDKVELSNNVQATVHQLFDARCQRLYTDSKIRTKDISVLFADMQGFTAWVHENLEHYERVGYFLDQCLTAITGIVHKHGGTVDKFIGDAVMAVFDTLAPQHAEQAVASALAIREAMQKLGVTVNTGINSGVVFEGLFGLSSFSQYTIVGDVVNVASRLQSRARNGAILIGPDTYGHVKERHFDISPEQSAPEPQSKQEQYTCHVVHGHRPEGPPLHKGGNL